jgi:hypothetical protein
MKASKLFGIGTFGMQRQMCMLPVFLVAMVALIVLAASPDCLADEHIMPFDEASIFFELNDTDEDLGIHALIDGEGWRKVKIKDPNRRNMLNVSVKGYLRQQGLTELFFESAEPSFDELLPEDFFSRFPEGKYEIEGITLEKDKLKSTVELRQVMPAPPENVLVSGVPASEDCDEFVPVVSEPVVISWDPVTDSHPEVGEDGPIVVVKYQLVVEREEPTLLIYAVDLPPDVTEFPVPEEFTALGDEFKFEILVREASGNQTAVESCFEIE